MFFIHFLKNLGKYTGGPILKVEQTPVTTQPQTPFDWVVDTMTGISGFKLKVCGVKLNEVCGDFSLCRQWKGLAVFGSVWVSSRIWNFRGTPLWTNTCTFSSIVWNISICTYSALKLLNVCVTKSHELGVRMDPQEFSFVGDAPIIRHVKNGQTVY